MGSGVCHEPPGLFSAQHPNTGASGHLVRCWAPSTVLSSSEDSPRKSRLLRTATKPTETGRAGRHLQRAKESCQAKVQSETESDGTSALGVLGFSFFFLVYSNPISQHIGHQ